MQPEPVDRHEGDLARLGRLRYVVDPQPPGPCWSEWPTNWMLRAKPGTISGPSPQASRDRPADRAKPVNSGDRRSAFRHVRQQVSFRGADVVCEPGTHKYRPLEYGFR